MSRVKVLVYRNLHKDCWSVKALSGPQRGRVIAHRKSLTLRDCHFRVSEAGRQRVLREQRKNVHAGVVGYLSRGVPAQKRQVRYNPYLLPYFFDGNQKEVQTAEAVRFTEEGTVWTAKATSTKATVVHFMADNTLRNLCDGKLRGHWTQESGVPEEVTCPKCRKRLRSGVRIISRSTV